jgi:hypothetical protein
MACIFCSNVEVSRHTREQAAQMYQFRWSISIRRNRTTWKADFIAFVMVWAGPHSHIRLGGIYGCASVYHSPTSLYTLAPRKYSIQSEISTQLQCPPDVSKVCLVIRLQAVFCRTSPSAFYNKLLLNYLQGE